VTINPTIHERITEAPTHQVRMWLADLQAEFEPYVRGKGWWTAPSDSPLSQAGEKLSYLIGILSAELKFRDQLAEVA
jgi:hypothetical protein